MSKNKKSKYKKSNRFLNPLGLTKVYTKSKLFKKRTFNRKKILKYCLYALGVFVLIIIGTVIVFSFDLPKPGQLAHFQPINSTKIYDRNGKLIWDIHGEEKRTTVSSGDIPSAVKQATVAIEDRDFYNHHGIYLRSVFRAVFIDIITHSKSQGGSTITQQLVRNAIETIGTKKTFIRKIKEVILALEFERIHTKDEILALYLNEIPYGNNNYGIETAAQAYYGKDIKDLNPDKVGDINEKAKIYAKVATLASLPQSPSYYDPYGNHTDQLKYRRDSVLRKMVEQGYLKQDIADKAKAVEIADGIIRSKNSILAPHFAFYVREQLVDLLGGGQEGERLLSEGGYKVTTTLDLDKQQIAEQVIADDSASIFKNTKASNAALVSVDAKNGQILAMVGSVDFNNKSFGSVNITTSNRQPGSSFKPIVYATLFKKGWSPGSTLFDLESTYDQSHKNTIWPHDYSGGGRGPVAVRDALAQSLNISAIKAQALAGTKESIDTAKDLGITTLGSPDQYGLAMVLGAAEVKMVDMVGAYGTFANNGTLHPVSSILKIEDKNGQVIQEWKDQPKKALDENIAYEITSILTDNEARAPTFGIHNQLTLSDRPVAAKTGTTSAYRDAWTIGYTPQIVTAVWVGNNDNAEMTHSGAGAMAAAPIWHDYMLRAHQNMKVEEFTRPDSIKDCLITKYSNLKPTDKTPSDNIVHDICADWQNPTQDDNTFQVVKVYKPNPNILATDQTPPSLTEDKVFNVIHSERPDDPVWENPVQRWAQDNGIGTESVPTTKYDPSTANDKLSVSVLTPIDGSAVSGQITLSATASSIFGVSLVTFYIDDQQVAQPNAPWTVPLDTTKLTDGDHVFKVVAADIQAQQATSTVKFTVNNLASALVISAAKVTRSADKTSAVVTWITNVESSGNVSYGTSPSYGNNTDESRGNVKSHTVSISNLVPASTYHLKVTSTAASTTSSSDDISF